MGNTRRLRLPGHYGSPFAHMDGRALGLRYPGGLCPRLRVSPGAHRTIPRMAETPPEEEYRVPSTEYRVLSASSHSVLGTWYSLSGELEVAYLGAQLHQAAVLFALDREEEVHTGLAPDVGEEVAHAPAYCLDLAARSGRLGGQRELQVRAGLPDHPGIEYAHVAGHEEWTGVARPERREA